MENTPLYHGYRSEQALRIDQGLRSYMLGVYNLMALGIAFTAVVALLVMNSPAVMMAVALGPLKWVLFLALIGMGFFAPSLILSGRVMLAHAVYWSYAAIWGIMIAPMVALYLAQSPELVVRALGITALMFGAVSLVGYTTKRDLSGFSGFFMIASIGLLLAVVVNLIFFQSSMMSLVTSSLVVLLFSAVTAYETQAIKQMYYSADGPQMARSKSVFGAFLLYGSFITLFIHILNILGIMRSSN